MALYIILFLVMLQRLAELPLAARNTKALLARGAIETGAGHYPLFILLHSSWLFAILLTTPADAQLNQGLLIVFFLLQFARVWVIATLGGNWTTRIIRLPNQPLIKKGPYLYFSHPNYMIVVLEIALLPLIFGNWPVAVIWSAMNAALLTWRIYLENTALTSEI